MSQILLPNAWKKDAGQRSSFHSSEKTALKALRELVREYPALEEKIFTPSHQLNKFVQVSVNGRIFSAEELAKTSLPEDASLQVIVALAGG
jgi:hypothetical protein